MQRIRNLSAAEKKNLWNQAGSLGLGSYTFEKMLLGAPENGEGVEKPKDFIDKYSCRPRYFHLLKCL